jgi:hypothetical protein
MEAYDKLVKEKCGRLTDYQQIISGYTTERDLERSVLHIYKNPNIAKHFAGKAQLEKKVKEEILRKPAGKFREGIPKKPKVPNDANVKYKAHFTDETDLKAMIDMNLTGLREQLRRERAIKEQYEIKLVSIMADLDEKVARGITLTATELAKMKRYEDAIDEFDNQIVGLRSQVARGKVQEQALAEMHLDALTELSQAEEQLGKEKRRAERQQINISLEVLRNLPKKDWLEIIDGGYDVFTDFMDEDNFKTEAELNRMQVRTLVKYLFQNLRIDPNEFFQMYYPQMAEELSDNESEASEASEVSDLTNDSISIDEDEEAYSEGVYEEPDEVDYPE